MTHGARVQITDERLEQVEGFFDRHGGKAILIGRFVGLVRAIAPFLAGSSRHAAPALPALRRRRRRACGARRSCLLGYIFWQSFDTLVDYAKKGALALGARHRRSSSGSSGSYRWLREPENRRRARAWLERQAERPALRPVARVLRPVGAPQRAARRASSGTA